MHSSWCLELPVALKTWAPKMAPTSTPCPSVSLRRFYQARRLRLALTRLPSRTLLMLQSKMAIPRQNRRGRQTLSLKSNKQSKSEVQEPPTSTFHGRRCSSQMSFPDGGRITKSADPLSPRFIRNWLSVSTSNVSRHRTLARRNCGGVRVKSSRRLSRKSRTNSL